MIVEGDSCSVSKCIDFFLAHMTCTGVPVPCVNALQFVTAAES